MKRTIFYAALILILMVFSPFFWSCSNHFSVQGHITGLGNQNIHVVYASSMGVKDFYVMTKNDRFEVKGEAQDWTLVSIFDGQNQPLAHFFLDKGDNLQVKGDLTQRFRFEVKGPEIDENWYQFRTDHASEYQDGNPKRRDAAIEKYVKENPANVLSTVLLLFDYSQLDNKVQVDQLMAKIDKDAKPEPLLASYMTLMRKTRKNATALLPLVMLESKGDFSTFSPTTAQASLLYLWTNDLNHSSDIATLKQLSSSFSDRLQVGDVYLDPDSTVWRSTLKRDAATWKRYWAPEGPLNNQLINLNIQSTPVFVVTDSIGTIHYNGNKIQEAEKTVRALLKITK